MGYNISFSALTATAEAIDVTSNNIANAQTVGYKAGEYVFADQFFRAQDPQSRDRAGMGTYREAIRRNQSFGTLTGTQNALDLAISGKGMFVLAKDVSNNVPSQTPSVFQYTRNGQFAVDSQNRIVNENGMFLVGYPADVNGNVSNASFSVLKLDPKPLDAKQSTASTINLNLDNRGNPVAAVFDPTKSVTYSQSTAQTVYDASGNEHTLSVFYKKIDPAPLYLYPKTQGDNSSFQYNTKQNIYALGDTNGVLPTTFSDDINSSAAALSAGASGSAALSLASTADPAKAGDTTVSTLQDTKLKAFPAGQDKTYLLTLNDGTELTVTKEVSTTPGSTNVRYKYMSDRYEMYATLDGINVNTGNMDVTELSQLQKGWVSGQGVGSVNPPSISVTPGVTSVNESGQVVFQNLVAGQSISLGGLTLTATLPMSATDVATAFSSLTDGAKGSDLNSLQKSTKGTYSGALSGWDTGAISGALSDTIIFNSTTPAANVENLKAVVPGVAPTIVRTDGVTGSYENAAVTFNAAGLVANQSVTLGGLTFTANTVVTDADLASAFAGVKDGDTAATLNTKIGHPGYGTFSGVMSGWDVTSGSGGNNVIFTATGAHADVNNLVSAVNTALPAISQTTLGVTGAADQETVSMPIPGMLLGDSLEIGGLTFTANRDITQLELQAAFSGLAKGSPGNINPVVLNGTAYTPSSYGSYSGHLTNYTSDSSNTPGFITFNSALGNAPFHGVNNLTLTATPRSAGVVTAPTVSNTTLGTDVPATHDVRALGFTGVTMKAGDKLTIEGLSFTANRDLTDAEVEAAFASINANTTSGVLNTRAGHPTYGSYTGVFSANWNSSAIPIGGGDLSFTAVNAGALGTLGISAPAPTPFPRGLGTIGAIAAPTVAVAGLNDATEADDVTFSSLTQGQSINLGGLTFTATASSVSAVQVAAAFANLIDGNTGTALNAAGGAPTNYGTYSGVFSGWNTAPGQSSNIVTFTSSSPATTVAQVAAIVPGPAPAIITTPGVFDRTESNDVVFHQLNANQSTTLGGLTFTSTGITSAADVALAFSGLSDGDTGQALNAKGQSAYGTFSGTLTGWNTVAGLVNHATFVSSTPAVDITPNLASTIATSAPNITVIDGITGVTESAQVVFDPAPMAAGDSITLGGLTFTAGSQGATTQQVANAFANLRNGDITGHGLANGSYSGTFTGWSTTGVTNGNTIIAVSSRPNIDVTNLAVSANRRPQANTRITDIAISTAAAGKYTFTQGASQTGVTESAKVNFTALAAGKTMTLGGLTFTAGPIGATAAQVANAFSGLQDGATVGLGTNASNGSGSYSGQLTNWTTTQAIGSAVVFTSTDLNTNVTDLAAAQSGVAPAIAMNQGVTGSDETANVTFDSNGLVAGQTMTLGGLTFTANTTVTDVELASAFANLKDGDDAAALNIQGGHPTYGTYSGMFTGWKTGTNGTTATVPFTSTIAATNVDDLSASILTTPPSITPTEGVTGSVESALVDFAGPGLSAGQTMTLGGLTFTSTAATSAVNLANAFSALNDGDTGASLNASAKSAFGTFSGTLTGYSTVAGNANTQILFNATTQNTNITPDLASGLITPAPVATTLTQGVAGSASKYTITFPASGMKLGDQITVGGLSFTASRNITQAEAQAAFAGLANGATTGSGSTYGTYGAALTDFSTAVADVTTPGVVTFNSELGGAGAAPYHGPNALSRAVVQRTAGSVVSPGRTNVTLGADAVGGLAPTPAVPDVENYDFSNITGGQQMKGGDSLTIGGLKFTASSDLTAAQVAAAFAGLAAGATTGPSTLDGTYTGTFTTQWTTAAASGVNSDQVVFTAVSAGAIGAGHTGPSALPSIVATPRLASTFAVANPHQVTAGLNDATEIANMRFNSNLTSGQSITIAGLTFTATSTMNAQQVAAAFAGLNDGDTAAAITSNALNVSSTGIQQQNQTPGDGTHYDIERFNFTSQSLKSGDSLTVGGLTFTANIDLSSVEVASAFQNLTANETSTTLNNGGLQSGKGIYSGSFDSHWSTGTAFGQPISAPSLYIDFTAGSMGAIGSGAGAPPTIPVVSASYTPTKYGTYTGTFTGWNTVMGGAAHPPGAFSSYTDIEFTSSSQDAPVTDLIANVPGAAPSITVTQGVADVTESNDVVFHQLTKGQAVSIGGLTFISSGVTPAAEVANAFAGIVDGKTAAELNAIPHSAFGTFTGVMTGWNTTAGLVNHVTFTSSNPFTNVTPNLAATVPGPAPAIVTTQGIANVTESANVTFNAVGLPKGQTMTLAGLTFTASKDITDVQLAQAFSGLSDGDITGAGYSFGDYSGTFTGWNTAQFNNTSQVVFSSSTPAKGVPDLTPTFAGNPPTITKIDGIPNSNQVTLSANGKSQTVTLDSTTTVLNFDQLGIKINLATNGDSTSTIARIFDGQTITVGDGNPIGTMAFVGGKNIDSLARDDFGRPDFSSKMSISTTVGSGAALNKIAMTIDSTNMTAYSSAAQTYESTTNGNPFSQLTAFAFDNYGKLTASYDNGQTVVKGQLVIADFNNTEGLIPVGGNAYEMSGVTGMQSGKAIYSVANTGSLGAIHSKTVENSNVDVTYELVKLMTLQRQYSAASQAVKTQAATLIDDAIRIGQ